MGDEVVLLKEFRHRQAESRQHFIAYTLFGLCMVLSLQEILGEVKLTKWIFSQDP